MILHRFLFYFESKLFDLGFALALFLVLVVFTFVGSNESKNIGEEKTLQFNITVRKVIQLKIDSSLGLEQEDDHFYMDLENDSDIE